MITEHDMRYFIVRDVEGNEYVEKMVFGNLKRYVESCKNDDGMFIINPIDGASKMIRFYMIKEIVSLSYEQYQQYIRSYQK